MKEGCGVLFMIENGSGIIICGLVIFFLLAGIFLISHYKASEVRYDIVLALGREDCIGYLHVLGLSQNKWYKLNNFFIGSEGVLENAKILVEEGCPNNTPLIYLYYTENPFDTWGKEEILNDVGGYYENFYKNNDK